MAEFIASKLAEAVVSQAVHRIADLLDREASSLRGIKDDVERLQKELEYMQSFLKDADIKHGRNDLVRKWIAEVRDVACEIEDAIETYVYKVHSSYIKPFHLREIRAQINFIEAKLQSISDRRQRYGIEFHNGGQELIKGWRRSHPNEEEDDVIMLKSTIADLKDKLMLEEDRRCIVSIVGTGGLGKTTLAKKVYNDFDVKSNFDCCAWVFISQQCVAREVLYDILMQIGFQSDSSQRTSEMVKYSREFLEERKSNREFLKGLEDYELVALLKKELNEKRYLIVLDDIWSIDAWNNIKNAFPKGKLGSKIVFTTRIKEVALLADPNSSPIEPSLLTLTESWELLHQKAFPREIFGEHVCLTEFKELGKEMVSKCGGLPLAIVILGGLLRTKKSLEEWKEVQKDVISQIKELKSEQQYRVKDILNLSFQQLPYYLKPCFLYLGSFPEDNEISKRRLIRLWIAEGFVHSKEKEDAKGTLMEDIAEQYLGELIDRCMVQVDKMDHAGKAVKTCRFHDLMRDFCLSKAKDENFLEITQQHETTTRLGISSSVQSRRIAVQVNNGLGQQTLGTAEQVHPSIRSLLCFGLHKLPNIFGGKNYFWLLRVLELDLLTLPKIPHRIGNLIHLRYLRLKGSVVTREFKLPQSLSKLQNLRTLDLQGIEGWYVQLPSTVPRLRNLRHLLLPYNYVLPRWAIRPILGNDTLTKLHTLKGINAKDLIGHNSTLLMSNLRILDITRLRSHKEVTLVLESLSSDTLLGRLQCLKLELLEGTFPKLDLLSECHALSRLYLTGELPLKNISSLPKSLTKLVLRRSEFDQEKMEGLEMLPNLRVLELTGDQTMLKWVCSAHGFPKLEMLIIDTLLSLEEWKVEEGAMPYLKRLNINYCRELGEVPEGVKHIATLRELNITGMRKEFEDRVRRVNRYGTEGHDFYKVRHVPCITFLDNAPSAIKFLKLYNYWLSK